MAIISKELFDKCTAKECCQDVLHPGFKGCVDSGIFVLYSAVLGVFKFYIPIYVLELLLRNKKLDNKYYLRKKLKDFLKSWAYGITMTTTLFTTECLTRRIFGKYYYSTIIFLPAVFSGLSIFWENPKMKILNTIMFATMALECSAIYLKGEKIIKNSIVTDTTFFMMNNAIFMYLYKTNEFAKKATSLWFFDPRPKNDPKESLSKSPCCKKNYKCFTHILEDTKKTFATGYVIMMAKSLIAKFKKIIKNPLQISTVIFNKQALYNGLFFGLYVFIYQITCKYLYHIDTEERKIHSLIAGFLAGISYSINPNLQMNLLPITLTFQLLWINLREKYNIPRWRFPELFFAFCCGVLFHFRFMLSGYAPKYVINMVNMATNGHGNMFANNINNYFERRIQELGIPITKNL